MSQINLNSSVRANDRKVLLLIDGVGAIGYMPISMKIAVHINRLPYEVRNYVWTHGYGRMLADLCDREHIETKSGELASIANEIIRQKREILIVAKSGGTAIALNALARLDSNCIEQVVLLSPAVSPQYDLTRSINAVKGKVYSFNSKYDLFFLGLGTSIFGTPDGIKTKAAGCLGFHQASEHDKFHEIWWSPEMIRSLHFGEHSGTSSLPFLVKYVLPLLSESVAEVNVSVNSNLIKPA